MISSVAAAGLAKRLVENPPRDTHPALLMIYAVHFIIFLPVLIILSYTLGQVYPTLAAVEDPLPAYEALAIDDNGIPKDPADPITSSTARPGKPVTSSLRALNRLLRHGGGTWRALFRGFGSLFVIGLLTGATTAFISLLPFVGPRFAHLLALLAVAPLSTTWTHFIITPPSTDAGRSFFRRIPPLRKVYVATWFPIFLFWAASHAAVALPHILAVLIGLANPGSDSNPNQPGRPSPPTSYPEVSGAADIAKWLCVLGVGLGLQMLLVIPTQTALARVQASLLPADEDPVVPFDRSFGGRVEPEVVTGKGFATFGAALKTVPAASWVRIYLLRLKIIGVNMAVFAGIGVIVLLEVLVGAFMSGRK